MNNFFNKTKKNVKPEKKYYNNAIKVYNTIKKYYELIDIKKYSSDDNPEIFQKHSIHASLIYEIKNIIRFLKVCIKNNLTPNYSIYYRFLEKQEGINSDNTINNVNVGRAFRKEPTIKTSLNIDYYKKKNIKPPSSLNIWELAINEEHSFEYYINIEANYLFLHNYILNTDFSVSHLLAYLKSIINNKENIDLNFNLNLDDKFISKYIKKVNKVYAELGEKDDAIMKENLFQNYVKAEEIFQKKNKDDFEEKLTPRQLLSNSIRLTTRKKSLTNSNTNKTSKIFSSKISKSNSRKSK